MEHTGLTFPIPRNWNIILEKSEAELASGQVVDGAASRERMQQAIERLEENGASNDKAQNSAGE